MWLYKNISITGLDLPKFLENIHNKEGWEFVALTHYDNILVLRRYEKDLEVSINANTDGLAKSLKDAESALKEVGIMQGNEIKSFDTKKIELLKQVNMVFTATCITLVVGALIILWFKL